MSGKNLYKKNEKIQMLREQFLLSKKMYYSYLLNFIDEYWRNIYLKFREKFRKTTMLAMTINNVFHKAYIKTNRTTHTTHTTSTEHTTRITRTPQTEPSSDTTHPIHTEPQSETNKGNKCIPYDNLRHLIFRMKVVKKDKKAIKINKNKVNNCINMIKGMIILREDKAKDKAKDNLRHLIFRMKVVKIKDKKAIKINKNKVKNCINMIKGMILLKKDKANNT